MTSGSQFTRSHHLSIFEKFKSNETISFATAHRKRRPDMIWNCLDYGCIVYVWHAQDAIALISITSIAVIRPSLWFIDIIWQCLHFVMPTPCMHICGRMWSVRTEKGNSATTVTCIFNRALLNFHDIRLRIHAVAINYYRLECLSTN